MHGLQKYYLYKTEKQYVDFVNKVFYDFNFFFLHINISFNIEMSDRE